MFLDTLLARLAQMGDSPDYPRLATEVLGIRGAPAELARRLVTQALLMEDRRDTWRRVGERACLDAPALSGVYVFRDPDGRALYVGKAVNLRRRLRAHFADRRWLSLKPALARVARVEWEEVGSEIAGLMREATLIHELQPIVNVQTAMPVMRKRRIPRALLRDVVILVPGVEREAVDLIAARTDGRSIHRRTRREGADLSVHVERLWEFFHAPAGVGSQPDEGGLAPLIFSWLAGRGAPSTRLDPHATGSPDDLHACLATLFRDAQLFTERLVLAQRHRAMPDAAR